MYMNSKLPFVSALALAALAVPAVAQKVDQKLSIDAKPATVTAGGDLTVTGQLTGGTTRDISGQNITLRSDPFPYEGRFERIDSVDTDNAGNYKFTYKPGSNARYQTTAKGGVESPVVTAQVRVAVTRRVSDRTPNRGQRVRFRGKVGPAHDGKVAQIQRRTSSGWKKVADVTLTDGGDVVSVYSKRVRIRRSGRYRVHFNPADGDHVAGSSRRVRLTVG
jgi:hypothetical protein